MEPFTLVWLFWQFARLKSRLGDRVSAAVVPLFEADGPVSYREVADRVFPELRVFAYLAWLSQLGFMRAEAIAAGRELPYEPSMPGLSPTLVREVFRRELRVGPDGRLAGNPDLMVERIARQLGALAVENVARETGARALKMEPGEVASSWKYAGKHGHPIARFYVDAQDVSSEVGSAVESAGVRDLVDETFEDYEREFAAIEAEIEAEFERKVAESVRAAEQQFRLARQGRPFEKGAFVGYAIVPTGTFTCPFCLMQASRGAAFMTSLFETSTSAISTGVHPGCDCKFVPVFVGADYSGSDVVSGARELWREFTGGIPGNGSYSAFWRWLEDAEGKAALKRLVPGVTDADSNRRRKARRRAGID